MSEGPIQSLSPVALIPLAPSAPQVARQFPEPMALVLKVRLGAMPTVTLHTNNATLQLQPFVEVLAPASNSAFQSLFSLNVVSEGLGQAAGWRGGRPSRRPHFLPYSPHLLCSNHTGSSSGPDIPASGPLHMPHRVPRALFPWFLV